MSPRGRCFCNNAPNRLVEGTCLCQNPIEEISDDSSSLLQSIDDRASADESNLANSDTESSNFTLGFRNLKRGTGSNCCSNAGDGNENSLAAGGELNQRLIDMQVQICYNVCRNVLSDALQDLVKKRIATTEARPVSQNRRRKKPLRTECNDLDFNPR